MYQPHRLQQFPEYIFARMNKIIQEVEKSSGRKVLNFGIGSPDFPPSKLYIDKLEDLFNAKNAHLYPGYAANENFSNALIHWYKKRFGVEIKNTELLPLLGAKDGTSHLPLALADTNDEILIPNPGYPGFSGPLQLFGIKPIYYDLLEKNMFRMDLQDIEKKLSKKTRAMIINFPSNPTGQVATKEDLAIYVAFAKKHNILIVYDNAYAEITFDDFRAPSILEIPGAKNVAVELGSFSKSHSFAGYRMGWIVGNESVVQSLTKVKSQVDSGMSTPLQNLGAFALEYEDIPWRTQMLASYQTRRNIIAKKLEKLGLTFDVPKGALYIWAKIPDTARDAEIYSLELLRNKQVFFAPGSAFGSNGNRYVRVSICANIDAINKYL